MAEKTTVAKTRSRAKTIEVAIRDNAWKIVVMVAIGQFIANIAYDQWKLNQENA